ncbi:MAG: O-acetyl-ADP-ribose deacetylase [bacterium]
MIRLVLGDITLQKTDVIVNAANTTLLGGGGVDGAIHRAAGPRLLDECRGLGGCRTGEAKITSGYDLPARWVIHTVGPVWNGGKRNENELLGSCYKKSLELAFQKSARSIAFPAISTGVYRFPPDRAARIAVSEAHAFLQKHPEMETVFVCFSQETLSCYKSLLHGIKAEIS